MWKGVWKVCKTFCRAVSRETGYVNIKGGERNERKKIFLDKGGEMLIKCVSTRKQERCPVPHPRPEPKGQQEISPAGVIRCGLL